MGLDLYIEARIREKKTRRVISFSPEDKNTCDKRIGFFEICWWCGWEFCDIREKMIEISNKYTGSNYTDLDFVIPIPQVALREIYFCIINRVYLPNDVEWEMRYSYEKMNLINAEKLHNLLWNLNSIEYNNDICMEEEHIFDKNDWKSLENNPKAYEWEFRIFNSY